MNKQQQTSNEIYFKQIINSLKEGGIYTFPNLMASFTMKSGKLVAQNAQVLKAARKIVSKKAGLRLFTIEN